MRIYENIWHIYRLYDLIGVLVLNSPQFTNAQNTADTSEGSGVFEIGKVLPEQWGWFIVLGLGMIFAALGILMMALGLFYTVSVGSSGQGNIIGILFGSTTTAMGFVLFKKTVKSRSLILGKTKSSPASTSVGYQKKNTKPPY